MRLRPSLVSYARHVSPRGTSVALIAVTIFFRSGVLLLSPHALEDDPDGYRAVAENLLEHGTFGRGDVPTAYRPPLYPLVLVPCLAMGPWSRAAIGLLHLVLGVATVWLTLHLARRWGLGRWAWVAGLLVAVDPILLRQSTLIMTETLATLLAVAALALLTAAGREGVGGWGLGAGACIALAALCRPTFLPWLVLAAVILPWSARKVRGAGGKAHGLRPGGLKVFLCFAAGAAVVLSPWVIRNQMRFGRPIVSTTHGGYTLWEANNPDFYEYLRTGAPGSVWEATELNKAWLAVPRNNPAEELAADRLAYAEAWEAVRREPGMFFYACLVRLGRLWSPLPHRLTPSEATSTRLARNAVGLWYCGEQLLAAVGLWFLVRNRTAGVSKTSEVVSRTEALTPTLSQRERGEETTISKRDIGPTWLWGILLIACFSGVHALYWTDMRMRAPLEPVVALAAAAGAAGLVGWARRRN
jgi:4-amino-4-deoxy-L-arabinose transferase-like glycosyltransferase